MVDHVRWGMIGCGEVAEVKAGPGFQNARGSTLSAVASRSAGKARDFAARHGVPAAYDTASALIDDPRVDAVYIATPPSSHCELALAVARAGKPCLVEKPMALTYAECERMAAAFDAARVPLWVAYYRRALPRYLLVRHLLRQHIAGAITSVQIELFAPIASPERARSWRFDPTIAGGGLFFDMGAHCVDLIDFLVGPLTDVRALALNTGGAYEAEDLVVASFRAGDGAAGTGTWNFNADRAADRIVITGTRGSIGFSVFKDDPIEVVSEGREQRYESRNPPHVHQPMIQTIVDELRGEGRCEATASSALRAAAIMEQCVAAYYRRDSTP